MLTVRRLAACARRASVHAWQPPKASLQVRWTSDSAESNARTSRLLEQIAENGKKHLAGDGGARLQLLELCRKLENEVEKPPETLFKLGYAQRVHFLTLRLATQMKFWDTLSSNDNAPKTGEDLARPCNAEPLLASRIARHLAAMNSIREVAPDTYLHTPFSQMMQSRFAHHTVEFLFDFASPTHLATPAFLEETFYRTPSEPDKLPLQKAYSTPLTFFEIFQARPEVGLRFASMMEADSAAKASYADDHAYPFDLRMKTLPSTSSVLAVDCGAGNGSDMIHLRTRYPSLGGRIIAQDLPYIADQDSTLLPRLTKANVEFMPHDFNAPQPIASAQFYCFRQIMQDYSDEKCLHILNQVTPVMDKGYSKILVTETIMPEMGAHWATTALDLELMLHLGSFKRTEKQMRDLLARAGLRIEGVWKVEGSFDSVIEAVLDDRN